MKNSENKEIEFPKEYYELERKLVYELLSSNNYLYNKLEYYIPTSTYLLGNKLSDKISNKTLSHIWHNLVIMLEKNNIDMFMLHWESMDYRLRDYMFMKTYGERNNKYLIGQNDAREESDHDDTSGESFQPMLIGTKIKSMYCALGGLVLYLQKYDAMKRMFSYTSSEPPEYHLLPNSLKEVFELFVFFYDPWGDHFNFISSDYYFPHIEGINSDGIIKKWICSYLAILFFRIYRLRPNYSELDLLDIAELPKAQRQRQIWLESIDGFRYYVKAYIKQPQLFESIGLGNLDKIWQDDVNKVPEKVIDKLKNKITNEMKLSIITQELSKDKIQIFYDSSTQQFVDYLSSLKKLLSNKSTEEEISRTYVQGRRIVLEKHCFQSNNVMSIDNYNSILASMVITDFKQKFYYSFIMSTSEKYHFHPEEMFLAIDKLKLDKNKHTIVNSNINIGYYIEVLKVKGLEDNKYNGIDIVELEGFGGVDSYSFFVIEKANLPYIKYHKLKKEEIAKYTYVNLFETQSDNDPVNIYASVIDLNKEKDLIDEIKVYNPDKDLEIYALVSIGMLAEIQWSKGVKMVQITRSMRRESQQLLSNLSDVKKF